MVDMGSNITFNQQYQLLHQQGHQNPDPWAQFLNNLIHQITTWWNQHKAVLICIDVNDNPQHINKSGISRIFHEMDLLNLHTARHPANMQPPTYNQGTIPIDLCAGSLEFAEALTAAWYLPFGMPIRLKGNHRTLGLDFNSETLFCQHTVNPYKPPSRGIYSNNLSCTYQPVHRWKTAYRWFSCQILMDTIQLLF